MDIQKIFEVLPHRYPMLLVDRILGIDEGTKCRGIKNVTINEAFFQGHYPGKPIMPGVLIVEAMAQTGAFILLTSTEHSGKTPLIGGLDNIKFRRQVVPGDQLVMEAELLKMKGDIGRLAATAHVDGELAAQMEMTFKLVKVAD